jgi:hypothetical protein
MSTNDVRGPKTAKPLATAEAGAGSMTYAAGTNPIAPALNHDSEGSCVRL